MGSSRSARTADINLFSALLNRCRPRLDARLARILAQAEKRYSKEGVEVRELLTAVRSVSMRGGKRLRGALVYVGARAGSGNAPPRTLLAAAAALELIQTYFLVHDDWMDQDRVRRGGPSVHAALEEVFDTPHLAASAAILGGDLLFALATEELANAAALSPDVVTSAQLLRAYALLQQQAVIGQQLDVIGMTRQAERVYALKTGSYTVAGPLRMGAILAGADSKILAKLDRIAAPLGLAFQLRDDLLGLYGAEEVTGKPRGNDLRAGKWTWTVQHALQTDARGAIERCFGNAKASQPSVETALKALEGAGAREATEAHIATCLAQSERALQRAALPPDCERLLRDASVALVERSH